MKKKLILLLFTAILGLNVVNAQGGGTPRQTPEERGKAAMEKLAPLNLDADANAKTALVMTDFFGAQQKYMDEMRAGGNMDREAMMAKRKELSAARDEKLKAIFTPEQMKKWTDEIEPSLRPQRGNGQRPQ